MHQWRTDLGEFVLLLMLFSDIIFSAAAYSVASGQTDCEYPLGL